MIFSFGLEEVKLYMGMEDGVVDFEFYELGKLWILSWFLYEIITVIL